MTREELLEKICPYECRDKCITDDIDCDICKKIVGLMLDEYDKQIRADAIEECADKFADILSNIPKLCGGYCPVKCNWGTEENCKSMCKKWLLKKLKEQKND